MRAIELNHVAVTMNQLAFSIGRMAAGDAGALETLWQQRHAGASLAASTAVDAADKLDALIADREARLAAYGGRGYVTRYRVLVDAARRAEARVLGSAGALGASDTSDTSDASDALGAPNSPGASATPGASGERITRAVATTFYRLLAVKDEYEVARLYTDPAFRDALEAQFEGVAGQDFRVKFNMAPPALSRVAHHNGNTGSSANALHVQPRKRTFGQWMWPVLRVLAGCRSLRGTPLDPFGRTTERRMERQLADDYQSTIERAMTVLTVDNASDIALLAELHARVRGYGHVKLANLVAVKRSERELAARVGVEAATGAAVQRALDEAKGAGTLKGIPVVVAR
jgi:indolepyruvate ferredoxin oxidoreductase